MIGYGKYRWETVPATELWNVGALERWLEARAAEGWSADRLGGRFVRFCRADPVRCRFRCQITAEVAPPEAETVETCALTGWHYVDRLDRFYRVWRCDDPGAPELETDPVAQSFGYAKLRKKLRNEARLLLMFGVLLLFFPLAVWLRDGSIDSVDFLVHGMGYGTLLSGLYYLWSLPRGIRLRWALRRMERTLAAGVPVDHAGDWRGLRRRERLRRGAYWLALLLIFVPGLYRAHMLPAWQAEAYASPPVVRVSAAEDSVTVLVDAKPLSRHYTVWAEPDITVELDILAVPALAEPLYRELLGEPKTAVVETVADSRFDRAVVVRAPTATRFLASRGKLVLSEWVDGSVDLARYADDFAAVLDRYE
jgi:hypothetical protein